MMKPMLAARMDNEQIKLLRYPLLASPKLDGVRGIVIDGILRSRSFKPFPNPCVQERFSQIKYSGFDGELILGSPTAKDVYRRTNSAVSRHDGTPDVKFFVFDNHLSKGGFYTRWHDLYRLRLGSSVEILHHKVIHTYDQLIDYEQECLGEGYEGVMLRDPKGKYKFGRSTFREGGLIKLKRFHDSEAEILEVVEELQNANEAKRNELGKLERSSHKANMIPKGRAGSLRVKDTSSGIEFHIGTGMDDDDRQYFWKHRQEVIGRIIKYKHFPGGAKDLPRFPVFLGLRSSFDL